MARWQLTEPCYLNCPGTYWEQVVTDRKTQRPMRKQYPVPRHLDPRIEDDWTHKAVDNEMDGKIVVCYQGKGEGRDIVFEGPPNPGMLPLDDEAREISGKFNWLPTEKVSDGYNPDDTSHQAKVLAGLTKQLADAMTSAPQASAPAGMDKFMESMAAMMQQQTLIFAGMMERMQLGAFVAQAQAAGAEAPEAAEPLPEADAPTEEELATAAEEAKQKEIDSRARAREVARGVRRA